MLLLFLGLGLRASASASTMLHPQRLEYCTLKKGYWGYWDGDAVVYGVQRSALLACFHTCWSTIGKRTEEGEGSPLCS